MIDQGILVAADQTQEWILPWWIQHYQKYNSYPIAFIDMGLSFEKKEWCKKRGELISLRVADFAEKPDLKLAKKWEDEVGKGFWESRNAWFKKPLACQKSPFRKTIWLDIDCEVRSSLTPLFEYTNRPPGFAIAKEQLYRAENHQLYNSGVIVFCQHHPLLKKWTEACLSRTSYFAGDQDVLSKVIHEDQENIEDLPAIYNWSRCLPEESKALIYHWHGPHGKRVIKHLIESERA